MHRFRLFAVLALALLLSAAVSTARATASTTQQQITWTQSQVMVADWVYQSDCDTTQVLVNGVIGRVRINGTRSVSPLASVFISRYDNCTNTFVILVASSPAPLSGTMQINAGLTSARMTGTFPVTDVITGTAYTVSVDVAWTASGTATRTESQFTTQSPGLVVHGQTESVQQPAVASGTVSDGTTNYTQQPASFAAMDSSKNGSLAITIG